MKTWIPIVISGFSLLLSFFIYLRSRRSSKVAYFGSMIGSILEKNLQHPEFNAPDFTNAYPNLEPEAKKEYDIYAIMVWNCIGLLSIEYGTRIDRCPFWGTVEYWSNLHRKWMEVDKNRMMYSGLSFILPGLDYCASFDEKRFPNILRAKRHERIKNTIAQVVYFHMLFPFLYPISSTYRKRYKDYVRASA